MTAPADGEPLQADATVLRLPTPPVDYEPTKSKPTGREFEPSSEDKKAATEGKKIRVSVWDKHRTTLVQAKAFREGPVWPLRLALPALRAVAERHDAIIPVVYDPLDPAESKKPGAEGHAGLENLERAGRPRPKWHKLLEAIADACEPEP
jgi:hypothetical protein